MIETQETLITELQLDIMAAGDVVYDLDMGLTEIIQDIYDRRDYKEKAEILSYIVAHTIFDNSLRELNTPEEQITEKITEYKKDFMHKIDILAIRIKGDRYDSLNKRRKNYSCKSDPFVKTKDDLNQHQSKKCLLNA